MGIWPIHIASIHKGKFDVEFFGCSLLNFLIRLEFLIVELAAGEAHHGQPFRFVFFVQLAQLSVVFPCEGSHWCHICDDHYFVAFHVVSHQTLFQVDVPDFNRPKLADLFRIAVVFALLKEKLEAYTVLSVAHMVSLSMGSVCFYNKKL